MLQDVGTYLKRYRKRAQLTQSELARSLGISSKFISKWEGGHCLPPLCRLNKLCTILNIPKDQIIKRLLEIEKNKITESLLN